MHRVPREWQHVVCICADDHGTKHLESKEHFFMVCIKCLKLKRYYTSYCYGCKKFYLMVFDHPAWSPQVNRCFDCINKVTEEYCSPKAVNPPLDKFRYPAVLQTPEEIAAELDSVLSFEF